MKKIFKKRLLNKLIILTYFLLTPVTSSAEVGDKKWTKECNKENKKVCVIAINLLASAPNSDKKQTLVTAVIQQGSTTKREMALIDGEEKTYKLKEKKKFVDVLSVRLPLNVDLKKKPLLQIDKKDVLNITYSHCNQIAGCVTSAVINNEVVKLFKSGKELTVIMSIYGKEDNLSVSLPLKGFSKAYDNFSK